MAYHEEHIPQAIPEVIQRTSIERRLLLGGAGKVADESQAAKADIDLGVTSAAFKSSVSGAEYNCSTTFFSL